MLNNAIIDRWMDVRVFLNFTKSPKWLFTLITAVGGYRYIEYIEYKGGLPGTQPVAVITM